LHTGDKVKFNTVDFVESRLLPKRATRSTVADAVNVVADAVDVVADAVNVVADAVDVVASV